MVEYAYEGTGLSAVPEARAGAATILVVDDDPAVLRMLRLLFEDRGYGVIEAHHGREAVMAYLACDGVELVVSDIEMPVMDGLALCRWLDRVADGVPVIVISGLDVDPAEVRGASGAVVGFLRKPFAVEKLAEMATAVISASR